MASINTHMQKLKKLLFNEIRNLDIDTSIFSIGSLSGVPDKEMDELYFRSPGSLRLTFTGFIIVKKIFTAYSFDLPDTTKTRHYYGLSTLQYPYFLTSRRVVLFSESDVLMIKLSGNIDKFLESCYNNR